MNEELWRKLIVFGGIGLTLLYFGLLKIIRMYREYKKTCLECGEPRREGFNTNSKAAIDVLCKSCCDNYVAYMSSL